jgi:acyl-CoA synthetase (AMP-forming)/AMP-acid ligase II
MAASPLAPVPELARQLKLTGARVLITAPALLEGARAAAAEAGLDEVIVLGDAPGAVSLSALLADEPAAPQVAPSTDTAALLWSSGTTGLPKAVELTHRNLVANLLQAAGPLDLQPGHRMLGLAPFFHAMGLTPILNFTLRAVRPWSPWRDSTSRRCSLRSSGTASPTRSSPRQSAWRCPATRSSSATTSPRSRCWRWARRR